jgi:hypothetical protein
MADLRIFGRVAHLWREDCKEKALRNVHLQDCEDAVVSLAFSDRDLAISKALKGDLTVTTSSKVRIVKPYLDQARSERLILRAADMTSFVNKTKADKRQEVANIVGYDAVLGFRNTIQSTLNARDETTHMQRRNPSPRHGRPNCCSSQAKP